MRVDAGLEEEASTNYEKISKAVGNMIAQGIDVETLDINKSEYMFTPDAENNKILFGLKGMQGMNGEFAEEIVANRPYSSMQDFIDRMKPNKTTVLNLIKGGAFDAFGTRQEQMNQFISMTSSPKKRITMQNFNGLLEAGLIPDELQFEQRVWVFNKALKKHMTYQKQYFKIEKNYYDFYKKFFDEDELEVVDNVVCINQKTWKKMYDNVMKKASNYFKEHQEELLEAYNKMLFDTEYAKYAQGNISSWEMDALGYYAEEHELAKVDTKSYQIRSYKDLPENPVQTNKAKNGYPVYDTQRIMGTVIGKNVNKSTVDILTTDSGVVTVKLYRELFANLNRQISSPDETGTNKVREKSWFSRGNKIMVNGFRRDDTFVCRAYKSTNAHPVYLITDVRDDGSMAFTHLRWGEVEE